jgi:hypothetical protein
MKRTSFIFLSALVLSAKLSAEVLPSNANLFDKANSDTFNRSSAQVHSDNMNHLARFIEMDVDGSRDAEKAKYIDLESAQDVVDTAEANPVVSSYQYYKYDPNNQGIGFCFGRAMFINLELAQRGFDRDSIKKAFVVGPMKTSDGNSWGWHVTTIAQSKDENGNEIWLALDPITGAINVKDWYQDMLDNYSTNKKLKFFITEAGKFGPVGGKYDQEHIKMDFYNSYFTDMMTWFEENSSEERYNKPIVELK